MRSLLRHKIHRLSFFYTENCGEEFELLCHYLALPNCLTMHLTSGHILAHLVNSWCREEAVSQRLQEGNYVRHPMQVNQLVTLPADYSELINQVSTFTWVCCFCHAWPSHGLVISFLSTGALSRMEMTAVHPLCVWSVVPCSALRAIAAKQKWMVQLLGLPQPMPTPVVPELVSSSGEKPSAPSRLPNLTNLLCLIGSVNARCCWWVARPKGVSLHPRTWTTTGRPIRGWGGATHCIFALSAISGSIAAGWATASLSKSPICLRRTPTSCPLSGNTSDAN